MPRERPRERRKRNRSFEQDDYRPPAAMDVEVLIAHDPMMLVDSDEEIDLGGSVVPAASLSASGSGSGGNRSRRDSHSSSSSSAHKKSDQQRKKRQSQNKKDGSSSSKTKEKEVNEDGVDNEEVFYVEKIKDKRWNLGRWEYLLQWQGYGPEFDTWEPTSNMDCDDLLQEFEAEWEKKPKFGFDRGEVAREIVGLCIVKGVPKFLILYKGSDDAELVPRKVCAEKCPQLVIEFYENRQLAKPSEDFEMEEDKTENDKENGSGSDKEKTATAMAGDKPGVEPAAGAMV